MASYIRYRIFQPLYPGQPEKQIDGLQSTTTFDELVKKICSKERKDRGTTAHLYLPNGIPLNRNVASETWTLQDWHIKSGTLLLVIFCDAKYNGHDDLCPPVASGDTADHTDGSCTLKVRGLKCCNIQIDQNQDNSKSLYEKVRSATNIPVNWMELQYNGRDIAKTKTPLSDYGLTEFSTLDLILRPQPANPLWYSLFDATKCKPLVPQSDAGTSAFYSTLYVISHYISQGNTDLNILGQLLHLTACPPLIHALAMLFDKRMISIAQRVAINEILYETFRALVPQTGINKVFEESLRCWTSIFSRASPVYTLPDDFDKTFHFYCTSCSSRLIYPLSMATQVDTGSAVCSICAKIFEMGKTHYSHNSVLAQLMIALPLEDDASFWELVIDQNQWPTPMKPQLDHGCSNIPVYLKISNPTDLRNKPQANLPPRLTLNGENRIVIFTERSKLLERGKTHYLLDPLTGMEKLCDLNDIAHNLQDHLTGGNYTHVSYITQPPDEAVLVVLDVSRSMDSMAYPGFSQLDAAKIIFAIFAERIMAFGKSIVVGLTTFSNSPRRICRLSEAGETFVKTLIGKTQTLTPGGGTELWQALQHACNDLQEIKRNYPKCVKRILCLTDGFDNRDRRGRTACVQQLYEGDVVLDCILIGADNAAAKAAAIATGGHAFYFSKIEDAMKLPDEEAFLSVNLRQGLPQKTIAVSESNLHELESHKYTSNLPVQPLPLFSSSASYPIPILKMFASESIGSACKKQRDNSKYILKELVYMVKYPLMGIEILIIQKDISFWKCLLAGPPQSPYSEGNFVLNVHFPTDYPTNPPDIRFETKILHCNISKDGHICDHMLNRNYYSPDYTMRDILKEIYSLLRVPNPIDLADGSKALEYILDRKAFNAEAKRLTQQHARMPAATLKRKLTGNVLPLSTNDGDDDIPQDAWFMIN